MKWKFIFPLLAWLNLSGCSNRLETAVAENEMAQAFLQATERFKELKATGQIPGFSKDDHGQIVSGPLEASSKHKLEYPAEVTMRVRKNNENDILYWLVFSKETAEASWRLVDIWKTDSRGKHRVALTVPDKI